MGSKRLLLVVSFAALAAAGLVGLGVASFGDRSAYAEESTGDGVCLTDDTSGCVVDKVAQALYQKGLDAREAGNESDATALFARVIEHDPDHTGARRAMGQVRSGDTWIALADAMKEKGLVQRGGQWILREEAEILDLPAKMKQLRKEEQAKAGKLLRAYAKNEPRARKYAAEALGTIDDRYKVEPLAYSLRSKSEAVRLLASKELGRIGNRRALRPLLHRVIHDPSEDVRHAAMDAARSIGDANLIAPLVKALGSENETTRMHAAEGLARARDVRGVRYLVYRFEAHGGGAPRAYSMFANQLTFIQDFDVEVAQTAFIADPIVGIIQEGIVLDAQVIATEQVEHFIEREVIYGALTELTGATDVPNKKGAWAAWFRENGEELEKQALKAAASKESAAR